MSKAIKWFFHANLSRCWLRVFTKKIFDCDHGDVKGIMYLLKVICCYHRIFLIHSLIILSVVSLVPVASKADQTTEILIQAVNTMRAARGLSQLDPDPRLSKVAQQRISAPHFFQPSKDQHLSKLTHHFGFLFRWIGECQARGGKKSAHHIQTMA